MQGKMNHVSAIAVGEEASIGRRNKAADPIVERHPKLRNGREARAMECNGEVHVRRAHDWMAAVADLFDLVRST